MSEQESAYRTVLAPAMVSGYVADQILYCRQQRGLATTPMHIIKLAYISHGWMLGINHVPLLTEPVEAWQYGPVVPSLYHRFKAFGGGHVTVQGQNKVAELSSGAVGMVDSVVHAYRDYSAIDLSNITHAIGTPWHRTVIAYGSGAIIPDEFIREYYSARAKGNT